MSELQSQGEKEVAIAKINVALTRASFSIQALHDIESSLVYNEDNMAAMATVMDMAKKMNKVVDTEHATMKEEPLRKCQAIDEGKRNMKSLIDEVGNKVSAKYTEMAQSIEKRRKAAEQEEQRKKQAKGSIDYMMMYFSSEIANCKTDSQLLSVERLINLEKANKSKYQEFLSEAVEKFSTLTALVKTQKESIREYQRLEEERLKAESAKDDEALMKIHEQQTTLEAKIDEAKVLVQETAINQSVNAVTEAVEVLPTIKVKRAAWTWEVADINQTFKKMPSWTEINPVTAKIDDFMAASKEQWKAENKEEIVVNGIKFYLNKTY